MRTYEEEKQLAECIIEDARTYIDHAMADEEIVQSTFYDDLYELDLIEEDTDLYIVRLDLVFYRQQF